MVKSQYVSLQDAALLANKSPQTIRRLIKASKIRYRKYKTPQGFTYLVEKSNLLDYFKTAEFDEEEDQALMDEEGEDLELVEDFDPTLVPSAPHHPRPHETIPSHAHSSSPRDIYDLPLDPPRPLSSNGFAPPENGSSHVIITQLVQQHREDKKRLFELLETFQKRIFILEEQLKQVEAPKTIRRRRFFFF